MTVPELVGSSHCPISRVYGHLEFRAHLCPVTAFSGTFRNPWARKGSDGNGKFGLCGGRSSDGQNACLSRRRPRVRVPSLPPASYNRSSGTGISAIGRSPNWEARSPSLNRAGWRAAPASCACATDRTTPLRCCRGTQLIATRRSPARAQWRG